MGNRISIDARRGAIIALIVIALTCMALLGIVPNAHASIRTYNTDSTTPASGNTYVGIVGTFGNDMDKALARMNAIRKEACTKGYINPATGKKLKASDYTPLRWSSSLENIARIRAAESTIVYDHVRPDGTGCFSCHYGSVSSFGESLAWNYSKSMTGGVDQWYDEKADWVNQTAGRVTGHYTAMINPENKRVGIASFFGTYNTYAWPNGVAAEFSSDTTLSGGHSFGYGNAIQKIEMKKKDVSYKITSSSTIMPGASKTMTFSATVTGMNFFGDAKLTMNNLRAYNVTATWSSSNSNLTVSGSKVTARKIGSARISMKADGKVTSKVIRTAVNSTSIVRLSTGKRSLAVAAKAVNGASSYTYWYRAVGTSTWSKKKVSSYKTTLTRLKPNKRYQVKVVVNKTLAGKTQASNACAIKTSNSIRS